MAGYNLAHLADALAAKRDEHQALYDEHGDRLDLGRADGFRLALSFLSIYTGGDFGQLIGEQAAAAKAKAAEQVVEVAE